MKILFDLAIFPLSVTDNVLLNFIILLVVGVLSFQLAYFLVAEIGLSGILGSILHWIIRFMIYVTLCFFIKLAFDIYYFMISVPITIYIAVMLGALLILTIKESIDNKNSLLNKKII